MFFAANLMTPELGLWFWTTVVFVILWTLLAKVAWGPIVGGLRAREESIANSLQEAENARAEMASLKADHNKLLMDAKEERAKILKEAKEIKEGIIADAKEQAKEEAAKVLADAKEAINNEKMAAITQVKNLVGTSAISLAKEVLKRELDNKSKHEKFIANEIKKIRLN